jgi:hypothetical protein
VSLLVLLVESASLGALSVHPCHFCCFRAYGTTLYMVRSALIPDARCLFALWGIVLVLNYYTIMSYIIIIIIYILGASRNSYKCACIYIDPFYATT